MIHRRELLKGAFFSMIGGAFTGESRDAPLRKSVSAVEVDITHFRHGGRKGFVIGSLSGKTPDYFNALAGTGARVARIFLPIRRCRTCLFECSDDDLATLDRILELAEDRRISLVLVAGFDFDDGQEEFWNTSALQNSAVEKWRLLADRYGRNKNIEAFDLLNEPNPPPGGADLRKAVSVWRDLGNRMINAIRSTGATTAIVYESVAGASAGGLQYLVPFEDGDVVYSIHQYSPHEITHQYVSSRWARAIPYPAGKEWGLGSWDPELGITAWDRSRMELELRHAIAFQSMYKVPIYVGEFSCVRWAPDGSAYRYLRDCLDIFRKYGWSWTYHEFRGWPGWDAEIASESRQMSGLQRDKDAPVIKLLTSDISGALTG